MENKYRKIHFNQTTSNPSVHPSAYGTGRIQGIVDKTNTLNPAARSPLEIFD